MKNSSSGIMKLYNIFVSIAMFLLAISELEFVSRMTAVEAKGKGKKVSCKHCIHLQTVLNIKREIC